MTSSIFLVSTAKTYLMANQRKITWTSLYFHPRSFVKKIQQFLWSLWWLYLEKNEEDDAEVRKRNSKTLTKSAWSNLYFSANLKKWRNRNNPSKTSQRSFFHQSLLFHLSSVRERKDKFWQMKKNIFLETFSTRPHICNWSLYRHFSPP